METADFGLPLTNRRVPAALESSVSLPKQSLDAVGKLEPIAETDYATRRGKFEFEDVILIKLKDDKLRSTVFSEVETPSITWQHIQRRDSKSFGISFSRAARWSFLIYVALIAPPFCRVHPIMLLLCALPIRSSANDRDWQPAPPLALPRITQEACATFCVVPHSRASAKFPSPLLLEDAQRILRNVGLHDNDAFM
ncbi:hypothetical protein AURDEDRAFT_177366 [Auricularia subglabra TFB-10046 SS5]|uniref:Uncharacterized protein n=1 Tax=Auricularia subglabra (strain TFB-10046 / SS5) TaxID=717982 RepID=J0CTD2_AURST|nr:hypothetical protein AURDEDRAFT_177366 [Auricularia subglabra TFB-10046 SS5]